MTRGANKYDLDDLIAGLRAEVTNLPTPYVARLESAVLRLADERDAAQSRLDRAIVLLEGADFDNHWDRCGNRDGDKCSDPETCSWHARIALLAEVEANR